MALKPTIYKFRIALSDLNRHYYDAINLTVAQHPSETIQRMMVRVLAFCINAQENLSLTKGLSNIEEPDLWVKNYDGTIDLWIEAGEPEPDRVKKACQLAKEVKVYSFNTKSDVWFMQNAAKFKQHPALFYQFDWSEICKLCELVERTTECSITISEDSAYVGAKLGECNIAWKTL